MKLLKCGLIMIIMPELVAGNNYHCWPVLLYPCELYEIIEVWLNYDNGAGIGSGE